MALETKKPLTAAERQQKRRNRLKAMGLVTHEIKLSAKENKLLQHGCIVRGGTRGPYSIDEYIATLIQNDAKQLERDLSQLDPCQYCHKTLPQGCDGTHQGDSRCFHHTQYKTLML